LITNKDSIATADAWLNIKNLQTFPTHKMDHKRMSFMGATAILPWVTRANLMICLHARIDRVTDGKAILWPADKENKIRHIK
jgi:hypothetical protein